MHSFQHERKGKAESAGVPELLLVDQQSYK